jgi:hypothetical protein
MTAEGKPRRFRSVGDMPFPIWRKASRLRWGDDAHRRGGVLPFRRR